MPFSFFELRAMYENEEECGRAGQATVDTIIWRMRYAFWITKASDIYPEYVVFIAFQRQQWLRRRAPMLRLWPAYIACLVSAEMSVTIILGHFAPCFEYYFF
jgi:hypothetical protein